VTFRRDDQNAEKPTFYDGIQLIQLHLYATTGLIDWKANLTNYKEGME
jgi:hypothetical protein